VAKREPPDGEPAPELARLPPGRHGLPRSFVTENQRGRLAAGTISAVVEHGYNEATVSRIAAAAGVSRRTFYTFFSSRQEAYLDTYELIASHLREQIEAAGADAGPEWADRVRAGFAAMLEAFAANPDLARFCLIAPLSADQEIGERYLLSMKRLLGLLTAVLPQSASRRPSRAAEEGLVGGIAALIGGKVKAGEGERLPELLPDLLELALTPYVGREEAVRVARQGS
jgi:AcrR family transcriptional regulator